MPLFERTVNRERERESLGGRDLNWALTGQYLHAMCCHHLTTSHPCFTTFLIHCQGHIRFNKDRIYQHYKSIIVITSIIVNKPKPTDK